MFDFTNLTTCAFSAGYFKILSLLRPCCSVSTERHESNLSGSFIHWRGNWLIRAKALNGLCLDPGISDHATDLQALDIMRDKLAQNITIYLETHTQLNLSPVV